MTSHKSRNVTNVTLSPEAGAVFVLDLARPADTGEPSGPRLWIKRTKNGKAWKILVHPHGDDPSHCLFIPDQQQVTVVHDEHDYERWPE